MDVIDLDFIGDPENPCGYYISSDLVKMQLLPRTKNNL